MVQGIWSKEIVPKEHCTKEIGPKTFWTQGNWTQDMLDPKKKKLDPREICPKGNWTQYNWTQDMLDPKKKKLDPREICPKGN